MKPLKLSLTTLCLIALVGLSACRHKATIYVDPGSSAPAAKTGDVLLWRPLSHETPPFYIYATPGACLEKYTGSPIPDPQRPPNVELLAFNPDNMTKCTITAKPTDVQFSYYVYFPDINDTKTKRGGFHSDVYSEHQGYTQIIGGCRNCPSPVSSQFFRPVRPPTRSHPIPADGPGASLTIHFDCDNPTNTYIKGDPIPDVVDSEKIEWKSQSLFTITFDDQNACPTGTTASHYVICTYSDTATKYGYTAAPYDSNGNPILTCSKGGSIVPRSSGARSPETEMSNEKRDK